MAIAQLREVQAEQSAFVEKVAWPSVFPLSQPVEVFGETFTELKLKRPTFSQINKYRIMDEGMSGDRFAELIAEFSGQTPQTINSLDGLDMMRLSKLIMDFFGQALKSGQT